MDRRTTVLRELLHANRYMTLATADGDGRPWASPVWFATADGRELFWASRPDTRHSRNVAERRRSRSWSSTRPDRLRNGRPCTCRPSLRWCPRRTSTVR